MDAIVEATLTDHLVAMYERDGKLTAESVLAAAADHDSPLHEAFEWDDRIAAHQYRLVQARELVRRAEVTIEERKVRRFVFIPSTDSYHPIEAAMSTKDWRAEVIEQFQRDAEAFHAKWANHKHVADHYRRWRTSL